MTIEYTRVLILRKTEHDDALLSFLQQFLYHYDDYDNLWCISKFGPVQWPTIIHSTKIIQNLKLSEKIHNVQRNITQKLTLPDE